MGNTDDGRLGGVEVAAQGSRQLGSNRGCFDIRSTDSSCVRMCIVGNMEGDIRSGNESQIGQQNGPTSNNPIRNLVVGPNQNSLLDSGHSSRVSTQVSIVVSSRKRAGMGSKGV